MSSIQGIPPSTPFILSASDPIPTPTSPAPALPTDAFVPGVQGGLPSAPPQAPAVHTAAPGPAQMADFFDSNRAHSVLEMQSQPATDDNPHGAWKVTTRPPFDFVTYNSSAPTTRLLSRDAAFGTRVGTVGAQEAPFGRWIRMHGGWVAQSVRPCQDDKGEVLASMLSTWLPDEGPMEMSLHEMHRDGSGTIFRLDIEGSKRDFSRPPAVLDSFHHEPGEPALPPFFHPVLPASTLTPMEECLGRIPTARFERNGQGAWTVELPDPKPTVRSLKFDLRDQAATGTVQGGTRSVEGVAFGTWVRGDGAWECTMEGILPPELFGKASATRLLTRLADDGKVSQTVRVENLDGTGHEYALDPAPYGGDHRLAGKAPQVLVDESFGEPRFETRTGIPQGPTGLPPELTGTPPPKPEGGIRDEGEWIIIGGVRIRKS